MRTRKDHVMYQYTTPNLTFTLNDVQLESGTQVSLTFQPWDKQTKKERGEAVTFDNLPFVVDGNDTVVTLKLTQEQSASFPLGTMQAQINYKLPNGDRGVSDKKFIAVNKNLRSEVM